jgi:hypothetical protein
MAHNWAIVNRSKTTAAEWRLIVGVVWLAAVPLLVGQTRTLNKPALNETRGVIRAQDLAVVTQTSIVPSLFGMNPDEVARVLEGLRLRPQFLARQIGIAVDQKPPAGTSVRWGSGVAVTFGALPKLIVSGPQAPAYAGNELTFTAAFVPPLPAGVTAGYHFDWHDGSRGESTGNAVMPHRFADAGQHVVSVTSFVNDRVKIDGTLSVDVVAPPPPPDTAQTATVSDTSVTTATVPATDPTDTTASTTSSATTITTATTTITTTSPTDSTTATTVATIETVGTTPIASTGTAVPPATPSSNLLVWIGAAAVVLLLVVTFLLARLLRELIRNRKVSEEQVQAKSPVAFNGGVRAIEYEIEHPELIRRGPVVGLRGGIRAEESGDV